MWQSIWPYLAALLPTALVAGFFYVLIKGMMVADRRERLAHSQFEAAQAADPEPDQGDASGDDR